MKHSVPDEIALKIDHWISVSKVNRESGKLILVVEALRSAWNEIPEPKFDYDFYPQSLSRALVNLYQDLRQFEEARAWLHVVRKVYEPPSDASESTIAFLEATVDYEAGDEDEAFAKFETLHAKYGMRPFQGQDKRYAAFFKSRKAK